jgi:hypothetical protein
MMEQGYETEGADFLMRVHERQMGSKSLYENLYFRLNKEIAPVFIRVFHELENKAYPSAEERKAALAQATQAVVEFIATAIVTLSLQLGGATKDENGTTDYGNARKIARVMVEGIAESVIDRLEKPKKAENTAAS